MVLSYYHAGGPWQHTLAPGRHGRLRSLRSAAGTATADKRDAGAPITGDPGSRGIPPATLATMRPLAAGSARRRTGGPSGAFPGGRSGADLRVPRKGSDGASDPPPGVRKPMTPQKARVETSTITAIRIPIMYRMEAPNALRYLRRPTTLR